MVNGGMTKVKAEHLGGEEKKKVGKGVV